MSPRTLLLRAAFLDDRDALEAWNAWQAGTSLDAVDDECFALLPLIHKRLEVLRPDDPHLGRLKGVRRRVWLENQIVLRDSARLVQRLQTAGIETLMLGGLPLVTRYYGDAGLRSIRQIEILVPRGDEVRAAEIVSPAPGNLTLLRRALFLGCPKKIEDAWWAEATPVRIQEAASRTLAPADQLVQTLVSGMWWRHQPRGLWMADALVILADARLDNARVIAMAEGLKVTLFVHRALTRIGKALGRPVAPELVEALGRSPISSVDRLELGYVSRPRWQRPLLSWFVAPSRRFYRSHS